MPRAINASSLFVLIALLVVTGQCAPQSPSAPESVDNDRIYGGRLAQERYVCSLAFFRSKGYICTGVLVSPHTVMTAAHCFWRHRKHDVRVYIGDRKRGASVPVPIKDIYVSMWFDGRVVNGHDIALVELDKEMPEECVIQPQYWADVNPSDSDRVVALGYGIIHHDKRDTPDLKQGTMKIAEWGKTLHKYYDKNCHAQTDDESNQIICAVSYGYPYWNEAGTCGGDSGGPLIKREYGMDYVVGINSFSLKKSRCSSPGNVDKFARVYPNGHAIEALIYEADASEWIKWD